MNKAKKELNLSPEDLFKEKGFITLLCLSILKGMSEEQKENYSTLMKNMIFANNVIEPLGTSPLRGHMQVLRHPDQKLDL